MSIAITENQKKRIGELSELAGLDLIKKFGLISIQRPDFIAINNKKEIILIEIKAKNRRFTPPPFEGHGTNKNQIDLRVKLYQTLGIKTLLLIHELWHNKWLGQWLDKLEAGEKFEVFNQKQQILEVIYPLKNFIWL